MPVRALHRWLSHPAVLRAAHLLDAERAQQFSLWVLNTLAGRRPQPLRSAQPVQLGSLSFANRIGVAAGLDKNAGAIVGLASLGAGFIEVGTVTPRPQTGSPPPRVFRLGEARALINRMGFPSIGAAEVADKLSRQPRLDCVIGINIGPNRDSEDPLADYLQCLRRLWIWGDYFVVNVSSPNTPGLRDWQRPDRLGQLLDGLYARREELVAETDLHRPIWVKLSSDFGADDLRRTAALLAQKNIEGVIASNTTRQRPDTVAGLPDVEQEGGLSGPPLHRASCELVRLLRSELPTDAVLVGSGGVEDGASAQNLLDAGADLVQLYTGLVFRGPRLIADIFDALERSPEISEQGL
ncbi:MAG: quinone-dependent dihydroorotate dehydrogenase [Gammaproteobacteria bacterium AqS3]|nr:quinone-dependent dihydroorotate dehydrogenase [Gammaproteobacteria bacterium AqS3]